MNIYRKYKIKYYNLSNNYIILNKLNIIYI